MQNPFGRFTLIVWSSGAGMAVSSRPGRLSSFVSSLEARSQVPLSPYLNCFLQIS